MLSEKGVAMSNKRIKAIQKIKPPTNNVKALQRVLGLFTFWRKFIRNYSQNTYHMRQLLRKGNKFYWSPECDKELEYLKTALMNPPILKPIDPHLPIHILVDSSSYGFGHLILQRAPDGTFHVVQYGSSATTEGQSKYSSDNLELLGLVYALKSIEPAA